MELEEPAGKYGMWRPHYTYEDYKNWEGRWELINGFPYAMDVYAMSPSPRKLHQRTERKASRIIEAALDGCPGQCACEVFHELDWKVDEQTVVCPDIMIVCGEFGDFLDFAPALVMEIASKSTRMKDRNTKFQLYQSQGVRYYLMADPDTKHIEIYELHNNVYIEVKSNRFQLTDTCAIELPLHEIFQ